mmetsp:Transcript_10523/g.20207  ORF Transcript_10523/g.20207 Transcript_10523/m.20207 type:complete len:200 (+) Transcript_10523:863-1462(+)
MAAKSMVRFTFSVFRVISCRNSLSFFCLRFTGQVESQLTMATRMLCAVAASLALGEKSKNEILHKQLTCDSFKVGRVEDGSGSIFTASILPFREKEEPSCGCSSVVRTLTVTRITCLFRAPCSLLTVIRSFSTSCLTLTSAANVPTRTPSSMTRRTLILRQSTRLTMRLAARLPSRFGNPSIHRQQHSYSYTLVLHSRN